MEKKNQTQWADVKKEPTARLWAERVVVAAGAGVALYLILRYGLALLAPFLIAWLLSRLIRPLVDRMVGHSRMPRGLAAGILVCLFAAGLVGLAVWGISRGVSEAGRLLSDVGDENSAVSIFFSKVKDVLDSASSHVPFLDKLSEHPDFGELCAELDRMVREGASQLLSALGQKLPSWILSILGSLPSLLIFSTSLVFACYYFSCDDGKLWRGFLSYLPSGYREKTETLRKRAAEAAKKYVKAYLLLSLITFFEMFVGLSILGVPYAFLISLGIALVDFLPLLGAGTVLIPWATVMFLLGNMRMGFGLLILFGAATVVRQFAEPKLISRELGLHPLASIFSVYVGWRMLGVWGMILAPFAALLVKALLQKRQDE